MKTCPTCQRTYPDDFSLCPRDGAPLAAQATATEAQLAAGLARRFRIIRRLGAGGMGAVFLAEQVGVGNRPVALKVLNRKLLDDPEFLLRFQNEAGSTGRISHANVVTIYESAQADDGTPFIAMQFLEGESLGEALKRRGALPVTEVAEILQQAARGLNAAHKLGIIHRDIKPDNIFLTRGDEGEMVVKLVDFGIAKLRESSSHTQTGMVLGTPPYMSYEQASGMRSDELDARSDVYSLGVVVYQVLTGRVPFHSDTPVGYLRKHLMEAPPPFRAIAPGLGVPPAVESVVMKALVKDRDQRFATVLDFARDFAQAVALPSPAESPKPLITAKRVDSEIPQVGAFRDLSRSDREPPLREPVSALLPSVMPAAPVARAADVGASSARPEAERRSALQPRHSAPPSPPAPRALEVVGAVREPPLRDHGARPLPKKRSIAGIASLLAAIVVVIVVALVWTHWPKPPGPPPGGPRQETTVPAKPEVPTPAPSVVNPATNPPSPQVTPAQIVVQTLPDAQVYLDDTFKGQVGRKGRLVIDNLNAGDHALRVALAGKKDFEQRVAVAAGEVATIPAKLADIESPPPSAPVEAPRRAVSAPVVGTLRENPKDGLKYAWIPPGTFMMGCSRGDTECGAGEKPAHQVTITKGFWMGQTPVTVGAYKRLAGATGRQMPTAPNFNTGWANENMPIVDVTWDEAQAYCGWLGGRLPTEAEWEYAARGGSTEARYGNLDEIAWYAQNSGNQTHDVAQKRANGFGLYDMLGNVWEWVNDWYDKNYYQNSPNQDPTGAASGQLRVLRGGSWLNFPRFVRVSNRVRNNPGDRNNVYGFRCGGEVFVP